MSASAPIRVRLRGRTSRSMSLRACSTAADSAVPSAGTWLRRAGAVAGPPVGGSPFVIVIRWSLSVGQAPRPPEHAKTLATRRGSLRSSVAGASVALVPPRSSVLPPGAGNEEAKKAVKPGKERAKQVEKGYVLGEVAHGHRDAAAIRRHDDGDGAALAISEEAQAIDSRCPAGSGSAQSKRPRGGRATQPRTGPSSRSAPRGASPEPAENEETACHGGLVAMDEGTRPDHHVQRCPASIPKSGRERAGLATTTAMGLTPIGAIFVTSPSACPRRWSGRWTRATPQPR